MNLKGISDHLRGSDEGDIERLRYVKTCLNSSEALVDYDASELGYILSQLYALGKAPSVADEDGYYVDKDFIDSDLKASLALGCMLSLLELLDRSVTCKAEEFLAMPVMLAFEHRGPSPWTNETCMDLSLKIISSITRMYNTDKIESVLSVPNENKETSKIVCRILEEIKIVLTKSKWKQNPASKRIYTELLFCLRFPEISFYLESLLPAALMILDDHESRHKIEGVRCLHHIMSHCSAAEVSMYGRADVVFDALQHLMYTREAELLEVLLPSVCKVLEILEPSTKNVEVALRRKDKHFQILERWLSDMQLEDLLVFRRLYAKYLNQLISQMGISSIGHLQRTLKVIAQYLEISDGPDEEARHHMLNVLDTLIIVTWPRIDKYSEDIVKMILRLAIDLSMDVQSVKHEHVEEGLLRQMVRCLTLLNATGCNKVRDILSGMDEDNGQGHMIKLFIKDCLKEMGNS